MSEEVWKEIPGWERLYEASDCGRIRRIGAAHGAVVGKVLSPTCARGYKIVNLFRNGKSHPRSVHRLVATTFISQPSPGLDVNHKNGIKADNRAQNLEWATRSQNIKHAFDTGLRSPVGVRGTSHPAAILTDAMVHLFRAARNTGARGAVTEAARSHGVSASSAHAAANGKTWKHLPNLQK